MANEQAVLLPDDFDTGVSLLQGASPTLRQVLTRYAERYKEGLIPQVSFAEWEKGVEESRKALKAVGRAARKKLEDAELSI
jgi:hypothetical protein